MVLVVLSAVPQVLLLLLLLEASCSDHSVLQPFDLAGVASARTHTDTYT